MTSTLRQDPTAPPGYANVSYERDTPQEERRAKPPKQPGDKEGKRRRPRGPPTADPIRDPVMRNVAAQQQQQLRVHIKAQPGTAVHITPSSTPPTRPGLDEAPAYHARPVAAGYQPQDVRAFTSGTESETEI